MEPSPDVWEQRWFSRPQPEVVTNLFPEPLCPNVLMPQGNIIATNIGQSCARYAVSARVCSQWLQRKAMFRLHLNRCRVPCSHKQQHLHRYKGTHHLHRLVPRVQTCMLLSGLIFTVLKFHQECVRCLKDLSDHLLRTTGGLILLKSMGSKLQPRTLTRHLPPD